MNIRHLNLNLLFVFTTIFEEGSISRASEKLAVSQPALSASLKQLREFCNDEMFVRTPNGVIPTDFSKKRYPEIRSILNELEHLITDQDEFKPEDVKRIFTLAMPDSRAALLLPELVKKLKPYRSNIKINIKYISCFNNPQKFLDENISLGIGCINKPSKLWSFEHIYDDRAIIVAHKKNLLIKKKRLTIKDYLNARHIAFVQNAFDERVWGDLSLKRKELKEKNTLVQTDSLFTLYYFLKNNRDYISTFSHVLTQHYQKGYHLAIKELPFTPEKISIGFITHKNQKEDAGLNWLKNMMRSLII